MTDAPKAPVISLNKARKARARAEAKAQADANAASFGRTKAEKLRDTAEATRAAQRLDAHRRDAELRDADQHDE